MSRKMAGGDGHRMKDIVKITVGYVRVSTPGQGGMRKFAARKLNVRLDSGRSAQSRPGIVVGKNAEAANFANSPQTVNQNKYRGSQDGQENFAEDCFRQPA